MDETLLSVWYVVGGSLFIALKPTHLGAYLLDEHVKTPSSSEIVW